MRQKARPGIGLRTKWPTKVRCSGSVGGKGLRPKQQIHWLDHWSLPLGIPLSGDSASGGTGAAIRAQNVH
jgi:hypothetical protein